MLELYVMLVHFQNIQIVFHLSEKNEYFMDQNFV